ncbi:hypothetical protein WJX72_008933 [[Myrmecia] bisecta]|uniref:ARID domain-containing protein n=1 Tax=[Myrmecia] bisecta TaxID=41462 RepID=A0AAW1PTC4_9CHLO
MCGSCQGQFVLRKGHVIFEGNEMTPSWFEKAGGKAAAKKWKTSIRVVQADGSQGPLMGNWLASRGVDVRGGALVRMGELPAHLRVAPPRATAAPRPTVMPRPPPVKAEAPPVDIVAHLQDHYIGLLEGDATVGSLPPDMPKSALSNASEVTVVDLDLHSHQDLLDLAQSSCSDPLAALLPVPPGVVPERQAYVTGQDPSGQAKRQRVDRSAAGPAAEAAAILHRHLAENSLEDPWQALGVKAPRIGGQPLDLRSLWTLVSGYGGYEATTSSKKWGKTAKRMGWDLGAVTNGGHLCRVNYKRFFRSEAG